MTSFLWSIRVQGKKTAVNFLIFLDNRECLIYNIDIFAQEISPPHLPFLCFILFYYYIFTAKFRIVKISGFVKSFVGPEFLSLIIKIQRLEERK